MLLLSPCSGNVGFTGLVFGKLLGGWLIGCPCGMCVELLFCAVAFNVDCAEPVE